MSARNYVTTKMGTRYTPPESVVFGRYEVRLMEIVADSERMLESIKQQAARKGWWVYLEGERNDGLHGIVLAQDVGPADEESLLH